MRGSSRTAAVLRIHPGEGAVAGRIFSLMVTAWAGAAVGGNAVESLFFARFGAENLPAMFIALGIVTFPVTLGVSALLSRADRQRALVAIPLALAGVTVALRFLLMVEAQWIYPVLWLSMMVVWIVLVLDTWGLAGLVHDTRQAKRLFPLYGAGVILGGALGGLITRPLAVTLHAENLLVVWGASLIATSLLAGSLPSRRRGATKGSEHARLTYLSRTRRLRRPDRHRGDRPSLVEGARAGARYVRGSRLLRWMSLTILLSNVLYFSLTLPFAKVATERFPSPDELAGFLGLFTAATNLGALVLSLVLANRLFSRLGLAEALVLLPVVYLAAFGSLVVVGPAFAALVALRFAQWVWMYGVWSIGWQALWGVVPPEQRQQARTFVDGGPMQWGVLLAGVLLLVSEGLLSDRQLFGVAMVVAMAAVAAAWQVRAAYRTALVDALRAGWPEVFVPDEQPFGGVITDRAARVTLSEAMQDPDPTIRRVAAEILASLPAEAGTAALQGLDDEDPTVRAVVLRAVASFGKSEALPLVVPLLQDPDEKVRAAAVSAAGVIRREQDLADVLRPLMADKDPTVRLHAALGILHHEPDDAALEMLRRLALSLEPGERADAVAALGELGLEAELVIVALDDDEPSVRRAAARSLPSFGEGIAVGPLVGALADEDQTVRDAVSAALVSLGDDVADHVAPFLDDHRREATAMDVLVRLPKPDPTLLRSYAVEERGRALHYHDLWRAVSLVGGDRLTMLAAGLRHRVLRHAEHAVRALAPFGDQDPIDLALQDVTSTDPNQRAHALEILETMSDVELVKPLLTVWEPVAGTIPADAALLHRMLEDDDPWIRACSAFASVVFEDPDLRQAVAHLARNDPDRTVREAAQQAIGQDERVKTLPTLSVIDRVMALQKVPLFRELSPEDLKHVAESLTENVYVGSTVIAAQGEVGDVMHVVVSGDVRVVVRGAASAEVARRGPGYIVGEMAILAEQPRMADLVAEGDVRTLSIERKRFQRILAERPDAALAVMRELCKRLLEAHAATPLTDSP